MSTITIHEVLFDGNRLDTAVPGLTVLGINPYIYPKRKVSTSELARTDKSRVTSGFFVERYITVKVGIGRDTRLQAEQSLDTLASLLQGIEKDLILQQSGAARKYVATWQDYPFPHAGGAYVEVDLVFECSDRFGYDTAYSTIVSLTGITAASRSDNFNFGGSAAWQQPYITIFYSALTGGTSKAVTIGNNATGQAVTITRTWAAGDRLEIDVPNGLVKVNGTEVAWTGALPEFAPGLGTLTYSDGLTTRTFNYTATYYKRYV